MLQMVSSKQNYWSSAPSMNPQSYKEGWQSSASQDWANHEQTWVKSSVKGTSPSSATQSATISTELEFESVAPQEESSVQL